MLAEARFGSLRDLPRRLAPSRACAGEARWSTPCEDRGAGVGESPRRGRLAGGWLIEEAEELERRRSGVLPPNREDGRRALIIPVPASSACAAPEA